MEWGSLGAWAGVLTGFVIGIVGVTTNRRQKTRILLDGIILIVFSALLLWSIKNPLPFNKLGTCILGLVFIGLTIFIFLNWVLTYEDQKTLFFASLSGALGLIIVVLVSFHFFGKVTSFCCDLNENKEVEIIEETEESIDPTPAEQITNLLQNLQEQIDAANYDPSLYREAFEDFHTERYKDDVGYEAFYVDRNFYSIIPNVEEDDVIDLLGDGTYWEAKHYQHHSNEPETVKVKWGVCVRVVDGEWLINAWDKADTSDCPNK